MVEVVSGGGWWLTMVAVAVAVAEKETLESKWQPKPPEVVSLEHFPVGSSPDLISSGESNISLPSTVVGDHNHVIAFAVTVATAAAVEVAVAAAQAAAKVVSLSRTKRETEQKNEGDLYMHLFYAYRRAYVPIDNVKAHQPCRSLLPHYSCAYDTLFIEKTEFLVNTLHVVFGETPPTSVLGEVVNVFLKYLSLSSNTPSDRADHVDCTESPRWKVGGTFNVIQSRNVVPVVDSGNS
ncbi:hypothetical protein CQW23_30977 [Capsicum baccatum]|uniref:Uncharacterized protein n=1 Tax=Capsicum baccatum TaxID=33114 RepID=A0A2G2V8V9_CAPBA|nr:hypothetical protein CQW23_30977 [Capsicum baccatum]